MKQKKTYFAKIKKIISVILAFLMIIPLGFSIPTSALAANTLVRQEVNITDAYYYATNNTYATSSEIASITDNSYTSPYYYFEVVASTTAATTASVSLVNATSSAIVKTISITGGNTYQRYRSTSFLPNASTTVEYKVVLNNENIGKGIIASRIIVLQNAPSLTNTETQIEIGSATTTAVNTTTLPLQSPKYWYYDSTKWNGSPTFYVEATYIVSPTASSTIFSVSATTTPTFYTYIGSAGVGYVVGEAWGGGDGVTSAATIGGGGGGGGTYARATTTVGVGSSNIIGVGRGGAGGTAKAVTASSTLTTALGLVLAAEGGEGSTSETGASTSTLSASVGGVIYAGGSGGNGETTADTGGGGGGSAGPNGFGISGRNAAAIGPGGNGGNGNNNLGGNGGAGGHGGDDTCNAENGAAGVNNVLGAGGGGGADGDASSVCLGGNGGRPGGGGGGSDEGPNTSSLGGPGQVKITEWIGTVGIALQESDGSGDGFQNFAYKQMVVVAGKTSTTTERIRSVSFSPTHGRNYRLVASTTNATAPYSIYNAKIVVTQTGTPTKIQPQYLLANKIFANNTSLQKFLTYWNSSEWSTTNAYVFQAETADGDGSIVGLNAAEGTLIANSLLSSPDNRATSTALCMPYLGDLDTQATTNSGFIFASRILVDVGGTPNSCGISPGTQKLIIRVGRLLNKVRLR